MGNSLSLDAVVEEQAALRRVAMLAATEVDASELFHRVCEELGRVLSVESTDIIRFDGNGGATVVGFWAEPDGPTFPVGMTLPVEGQTVTGELYRTGRPQHVDDYGGVEGELAEMIRSYGILSAAGAPITVAGRLWGALMASCTRPHAFPKGTEHRIAHFAELITAALANADARDQLAASRARIVEAGYAERRRLGRDLHDGAQQELVSAAMTLTLARKHVSGRAAELVDAALEQVHAGLRDLRELASGIHPSILTDRGLGAALEALATRSPVAVELSRVPGERLPLSIETTAYFVVAEALTNATKHADCDYVEVEAQVEDEWLVVRVEDDGVGGADASSGTGLRGMADRVSALGGELEIDSPPRRGTAIEARLALA